MPTGCAANSTPMGAYAHMAKPAATEAATPRWESAEDRILAGYAVSLPLAKIAA